MKFDPREAVFEWAWARGWRIELAGTTATVRDGGDYVMAEIELSHVQPEALRTAIRDIEFQKSAIHLAVNACGFLAKARRWEQKSDRS